VTGAAVGRPAPIVLVLQHEIMAPAGLFGAALREAGLRLDERVLCAGDPTPRGLADYDALLVLGGDMNVGEEAEYPFLAAEQELLREAVREGLPTLGICLGAQQLAASCGGGVVRRGALALGWSSFAVERDDALLAGVETTTPVFHWRQYACRLPDDAVLIASGDGDPQVFRLGAAAWGVQFHPEVSREILAGWVADDPDTVALVTGAAPDSLLAENERRLPASAALCRRLVANFVAATGFARR
jgi:GMP synthase (glutamine-hydrolysing)